MQKVTCLNCSHEFELNSWFTDSLGNHTTCNKCNSTFNIDVEQDHSVTERLLSFEYGGNNSIEKAIQLCDILENNNIDYVAYNLNQTYWNPSFLIRKGKMTWNDIMTLVNSIKAPCYRYKKETFFITKFLEHGRGNLKTIC